MQCRTPKKIQPAAKKYTVQMTGLVYESGTLHGYVTIDGTRHPSGVVSSSSPKKETLKLAEGTEIKVVLKRGSNSSSIYLNSTEVAKGGNSTNYVASYTLTLTADCLIAFAVSSRRCDITMPYTAT